MDRIARIGYDPQYGTRPPKRAVQRCVEDPLATLIIEGKLKSGGLVRCSGRGISLDSGVTALAPLAPGSEP